MGKCCTAGWRYRWIVNTESDARNAANVFNSCNYIGNCLASPDAGTLNIALANLASDRNIIYLSGHGNSHGVSAWANGEEFKIRLRTNPVQGEVNMSGYLSPQTECVIYAACRTADGDNSITKRSVRPGRAQNAIGWEKTVANGPFKCWVSRFLDAWSVYRDWGAAIDEANVGCCTCWCTGVKSAVRHSASQNMARDAVSEKKDSRLVWEGEPGEYPLDQENPDNVITYLKGVIPDFPDSQWKVLVSEQGGKDFCLDVVLMHDDVYTSSSYTVFVKDGYMKAVYDARFQIRAENPQWKTKLDDEAVEKEMSIARKEVEEADGKILEEKWYHFYDVEEDKPSVVILIEYQVSFPEDDEMNYTDMYMKQLY